MILPITQLQVKPSTEPVVPATNTIEHSLELPNLKFPDRTQQAKEAQAYDAAKASCEAQGGSFNDSGCVLPPPPPPVVVAPVVASYGPSILSKIRYCESGGNYGNEDTGRNGHFGAYQFSPGTWASVGGVGDPALASPAEQDMRAAILFSQEGTGPWLASMGCWSRL